MLRLKPNDVAIAPIFDPPKTAGGLIVPEIAKERSDQGIVKYMGTEVKDLYYGDHVMFAAYDGTLTRIDGEGILIILPFDKIVAILHPPETRIDGIYFKSRLEDEELYALQQELASIIVNEYKKEIQSPLEIARKILEAGFIKDQFYPMTYEMTIELIAQSITNAPWKSKFRFTDRRKASPSESRVF